MNSYKFISKLFFIGIIDYKVDVCGNNASECYIKLLDADRNTVAESDTCSGQLTIPNVIPWWPIMSGKKNIAYLYTFQVLFIIIVLLFYFSLGINYKSVLQVNTNNRNNADYYRMKIGIRNLQWTSKELLINNEPIYLRGFGKHEDSIVSNQLFVHNYNNIIY